MLSVSRSASSGLILFWLAFSAMVQAAGAPVPVETLPVVVQEYARPVRISGVLENKSEQNLAFKVGGLLRRVAVDEGQWVKAGQMLASLDLEEIDAQVAKAESVLSNAERNLERFRSLQGSDALSVEQLQRAETQVEVARSDLRVARFNQRHSVILAPADGRILKRFVEPNEMVANGKPAFLFASKQAGWVLRAGVTDRDIVRLSLNDTAAVSFDALPGQTFAAELSELAGRADQSQTFEVELRLAGNGSTPLLAGFVGHAVIIPAQAQPAALVPVAAMVRAAKGEAEVFVVGADGRAEKRSVRLLVLDEGNMVVTDGLSAGEQVIVSGAQFLTDGRELALPAQTADNP
ncbi:efflux RND transporter periplasmic adaptor subunit [Thalassolituus sp. LLYu03]|uniref:efflux RND transporter periplasmic adaptor subunit n=1 Tax=Thalassolituus sp. LLYu03 TaxID=3421656 RepID=UPI003D28267D